MNGKRYTETPDIVIESRDPRKKEKLRILDEIVAKRKLEILSADYDVVPHFKKKADFIVYCDEFVSEYKRKDIRKVAGTVEKFKDFYVKKSLQMNQLNSVLCSDFMDYLKSNQSGLNGETPYNYWGKFKGIVKRAYMEGYLTKNPMEGIRFTGRKDSKERLSKDVLSIDELRVLNDTDCPNKEVKRAFLFSSFTGLGLAEIYDLKGEDIKKGVLKYKRKKTGAVVTFPLHKSALNLLGDKFKNDDHLFNLPSDTAVNQNLKTWMKNAKIDKHITFYCGRHSFATNILIQKTGSVKDVMDVLGHTSLQHTIKYVKHTDQSKNKAVTSLPEL